ncbi:MAG TPA: YCF48-related protein [Thermoanaerobaculia bacterium]|nr:YCF48-related protein [Thermoanaerobaculia bacterium]
MRTPVRRLLFAAFAVLAALSPKGSLAAIGAWTSNGPTGGSVRAIAAVPSEPSTVYLATTRGIYRSVDSGAHWTSADLRDSVNLLLTTSTPSVVYAADLDGPTQFYRTTDGGENWVARSTPFARLRSAAVDVNDPMVLYAASSVGVFQTSDGGESWRELSKLPSGAVSAAIAVDPADSRVIYVSGNVPGQPGAIYRSSDGGATWTRTALREYTHELLFDPRDHSRLFAVTNSAGVQVSTNGGASWRRLAPEIQYPSRVAIDPADSSRLYILALGAVYLSSDGGETVIRVPAEAFREHVNAITVSGSSAVLAGSDRGLLRSEDGGHVWSDSSAGIREVSVRSLAIDATNPAVLFAGSAEGVHESLDGGNTWSVVPGSPETNVVAIDPNDRATLYAAGRSVLRTTNGGQTWLLRSPRDTASYIAALVIDPNNPRRLFASNEKVYRSLDGGENWTTVMKAEDTVESYYYPATASALAIAPSDSATVYAGGWTGDYASGFVSRSDDGGAGWFARSSLLSPVSALAVDSCDPRIVYAGTFGGVYRSTDGGETWSEPGLPGYFVYSLAADPRYSSSVFAGTAAGLFWTNDSGATWTLFEPYVLTPIVALAIDPSGRFLHVATNDGVFDLERTFEPCAGGGKRLCLLGGRFELQVTARNPRTGTGEGIEGQAVSDGDRFGYFSFPSLTGQTDFPEVIVKMRDATGQPPPYGGSMWVFHTALTDLDYTLTVRDTSTGRVRTYLSHKTGLLSEVACGEADTRAFAGACTAQTLPAHSSDAGLVDVLDPGLTLLGGRFRTTLSATDPRTGRIAEGQAIPRADAFGYFSLPGFTGDPSFPEVLVKMTDATALPGGRFWFFHTGLTDVEYTLTVTDQVTGAVRTYRRPAPAQPELCGQADTAAFRN